MKILITGSNGLLGQKLVYLLKDDVKVKLLATSKGVNRLDVKSGYKYIDLDITSKDDVIRVVREFGPDCIINCAAMTNVDTCESDREGCWDLNVGAVEYLLEASRPFDCHFIQLSTDFVFDGANGPYKEADKPNPLSYYAQSKLESEGLIMNSSAPWAIIRTIIIYGVTDGNQRSNLVLWVKSSLEQGKEIKVITDQYRSPTLAEDLATACVTAARKRSTGIYHISGDEKDICSIYDLAHQVADYYKLDASLMVPVTSDELGQAAKRPPKTGFILDKARRDLEYKPHRFHDGLQIVAEQLLEKSY